MTAAAMEAVIARSDELDGATVAWVETDLAVHLNRLAKAVTAATAERDAAIVTARAAGHSLREIGLATGLNHTVVLRIIRARADEAGES